MVRHPGCWASVLDDCSGSLTREHTYAIDSWATGDVDDVAATREHRARATVTTVLEDGTERTTSANGIVAKILCEGHNHATSDIDAEAGRFRVAHGGLREIHRARGHNELLNWAPRVFPVDGPLDGLRFERSMMKVVVNNFVARGDGIPLGSADAEPDRASARLAGMIFGKSPIEHPHGLWVDGSRERIDLDGKRIIEYMTAIKDGRAFIAGALVWYHGYRFAVVLSDVPPTRGRIDNSKWFRGARFLQPFREHGTRRIAARLEVTWPPERLKVVSLDRVIGSGD